MNFLARQKFISLLKYMYYTYSIYRDLYMYIQKLFYYTLLEKEHQKKQGVMEKWENIPNEMGALNIK